MNSMSYCGTFNMSINVDRARIALQQAIRHGNLDLAYSAFSVLAIEKQQWNWLKWNLPILIIKECWYMLGEYAELINETKIDPKTYKKFIYKLVLVDKSKDVINLVGFNELNLHCNTEVKHHELYLVRKIFNIANASLLTSDDIYNNYINVRKLSEYEQQVFSICMTHIFACGLFTNKLLFLITLLLISIRGLNKNVINEHIKYAIHRYKKRGGKKPKKIELNIDFDLKIPSYLINKTKIIKNPTCFQTMWNKNDLGY